MNTPQPPPSTGTLSDSQVIQRVRAGERAMFEILMRRHNQRLYRVVRAVLKSEHDVEDVMQQTYVNAFIHLHQFEERSLFSTWLTRIALNEACARRRRTRLLDPIPPEDGSTMLAVRSSLPDPERQAYAGELHQLIERAIDALPEGYRLVFILRDVEGLSTSETGAGLGLGVDVIKTRLYRARTMLRRSVSKRLRDGAPGVFPFHAPRCDRVVRSVFNGLVVVDLIEAHEVPA